MSSTPTPTTPKRETSTTTTPKVKTTPKTDNNATNITTAPTQVVSHRTYSPKVVQVNPASTTTSNSTWLQSWFTKSNIWLFVCFLALYVIVYLLMKTLLGESFTNAMASFVIDCFMFVVLAIFIVGYFTTSTSTNITVYDPLGNWMIWLRDFYDLPSNFLFLTLVMIFMYLMFFILHIPMGEHKPYSIAFIEIVMWVFYVTDIFAVIFLFLFGFSVTDLILNPMIQGWYGLAAGNLAQNATEVVAPDGSTVVAGGTGGVAAAPGTVTGGEAPACVMPSPTTIPPNCKDRTIPYIVRDTSGNIVNNMKELRDEVCLNIAKKKVTEAPTTAPSNQEVFNISNNLYTYQEAQELCSTYGARLATYDEIESAYVDGGEWCNYGWSDNQMALFPTQKDTWSRLQKTKDHKNDCGRPGVNGGFIDNTDFQFGANCYGVKPTPGANVHVAREPDIHFIDTSKKAVQDKLKNMPIEVNQFNRNQWSEYQRS